MPVALVYLVVQLTLFSLERAPSWDEAVYLSDRVVIMTPRPGRVAEVLEIPLARPRAPETREDPAFVRLTARIWERLKALGAAQPPAPARRTPA